MIHRLFLILLVAWCTDAHADPYSKLPSSIPLFKFIKAPSDLMYKGKKQTSKQAGLLDSKHNVDLSSLNPEETEFWQDLPIDHYRGERHGPNDIWQDSISDKMDVNESGDEFEFLDYIPTRKGAIRLSVRHVRTDQIYVIMLGSKSHNVLLRKALLRKLGYLVPPVNYLKSFNLKFKGGFSLKNFLNGVGRDSAKKRTAAQILAPSLGDGGGSPGNWATNIKAEIREVLKDGKPQSPPVHKEFWFVDNEKDKANHLVRLQDALIFKSENRMYHAARGFFSGSMIRNRRAFNAAFLPLALVEVPESINILPNEIGHIVNGQLILDYKVSQNFTTTLEDLLWISRRLFKLTRKDFEEIVAEGHYPLEVGALLTEKLISRRNNLRTILRLDHGAKIPKKYLSVYNESKDIHVNYNISAGENLENGRLEHRDWPGHGAQYSTETPGDRFAASELWALAKSKTLTNVVANFLSEINKSIFPDIGEKIARAVFEDQLDVAVENFVIFLKTGETSKTSFGHWSVPYFTGNLIGSREIVTGTYLGTDNDVQIADTVGIAIRGGIFAGTHGLPADVFANATAEGQFVRKYTRLKPIKSMERALTQPFENPILPFLLKGDIPELFGEFFKNVKKNEIDHKKDMEEGSAKERRQAEQDKLENLQSLLDQFFISLADQIEVNESLIISDSIGGKIEPTIGYNFAERLSLQIKMEAGIRVLSRLHIHRKNDYLFQVYDDLGNIEHFRISAGLNAGKLPITEINAKTSMGGAKTRVYNIDLDPNLKTNPEIVKNIKLIQGAILEGAIQPLQDTYPAYELEHDFNQSGFGLNFLFWKRKSLKTSDFMTITSPTGATKNYVTARTGVRTGRDFQNVAIDVINELIARHSTRGIVLAATHSGDPADTIFGRSKARSVSFDSIINPASGNQSKFLKESFAHVKYRWKGWEMDRDEVFEVVNGINTLINFELIPPSKFSQLEALQLYRIELSLLLYDRAIRKIIEVPNAKIQALIEAHGKEPEHKRTDGQFSLKNHRWNQYLTFLRIRKKFLKFQKRGLKKNSAEKGADLISHLEKSLPLPQILEIVGGPENIYVKAHLNGFRKGDVNGDQPILTNNLGRFGSKKPNGPLRHFQSNMNFTESEFFIYWLMERL